jgi:hypothetical protein
MICSRYDLAVLHDMVSYTLELRVFQYDTYVKYCWSEVKVLQIEPNNTYRKYKESAHMSLLDHLISQASLDTSPIWTPVITAEVKNYNSVKCRLSGNICFLVLVPLGVSLLSSDDFYCDSSLVQGFIHVEFKNLKINVFLSSRK